MALGEGLVRKASRTPDRYGTKVRPLAGIYAALNVLSVAVIVIVALRIRYLVTLTQRSNVETLVLAIVVVLAAYYVASTFTGAIGAVRMLAYDLPHLWGADARRIEQRKQRALHDDEEPLLVVRYPIQ